MNTIQPRIQTPPPLAEAGQTDAANRDSAAAAAPSQGFATAMDNACAKPARKTSSNKAAGGDAGGARLPGAGNPVPPATAALPAAPAWVAAPGGAASAPAAATPPSCPTSANSVGAAKLQATAAEVSAGQAMAHAKSINAAGASGAAAPDPGLGAATTSTDSASTPAVPTLAMSTAAATAVPATTAQAGVVKPAAGNASADGTAAVRGGGSVAGDARSAANKAGTTNDDAGVAADTTAASLDHPIATTAAAAAAANAAATVMVSNNGGADTAQSGSAAMLAPMGGAAAQNSAPDAATAVGVAASAASATAAITASAFSVTTDLAGTTAADKHARGGVSGIASASSTGGIDGTAGAALASSGAASPAVADAAPTFKIGAGIDSGEFGQGVANQVATMLASNISSAKLSVNPPALGPIEVRIAVQGDHAQVLMMSHSAVTRDALQASAPKLREMLNSQGFGQVSVDISQRSFQDRTPTAQTYEWNSGTDGSDLAAAAAVSASSVLRAANGILDAYA